MSDQTLDEFVATISDDDKLQIMRDHSEMEMNKGKTGETMLRKYSDAWMVQSGIANVNFIVVSELLTSRVWKYFAIKHVQDNML